MSNSRQDVNVPRKHKPAPRILCIPAVEAPVVAVLRRGPSDWSHVGRWHVEEPRYEAGAWLKGRIFPRRCDLSADGTLLCCFVHKPNAAWEHGDSYVTVSRLPWLDPIHAFGTCGTWTRGYYFCGPDQATAGGPWPFPYALQPFPAVQFPIERLRGWEETPDCPPREPSDVWDQHRNARMQKRQPGGGRMLYLESVGRAGGEFGVGQSVDGVRVRYGLDSGRGVAMLDDLQWADWDRHGRLLVATRCGAIEIREPDSSTANPVFREDLSLLEPNPVPPPRAEDDVSPQPPGR